MTAIGNPLPSLAEFMKIYSTVPSDFIDDLFAFYNEDTAQTDFAIDLDKVAKWLGVDRVALRTTLKSSYKHGIDYTENPLPKNAPKSHGGHMRKVTMLTPDCFKRLCMRSRSRRSEDVRTYFIDVESIVMRYRTQLLAGIREDVLRLERNQAGKAARRGTGAEGDSHTTHTTRTMRGGYVYVMRASPRYAHLLKIGRTNRLDRRMREHNAAQADDLELLFAFRTDNPEAVEACAKAMLRKHRYRSDREIYSADLSVVKALISKCDGIGRMIDAKAKARPSEGEEDDGVYLVAVVKDKRK